MVEQPPTAPVPERLPEEDYYWYSTMYDEWIEEFVTTGCDNTPRRDC